MKEKLAVALTAAMLMMFMLFNAFPVGSAEDAALSCKLVNQADGTFSYTLNVVVPQSLNEYYQGLSHRSASDADFPKFITPNALQPIADCLREIYPDDEDFANGVLTLVHQIPFKETLPAYYPVETLQMNGGDCDMFSLVAASIMKAGGLDVVLLHYTGEEHMNIGVHLDSKPQDARLDVYSLKNNGVTYYVAEATSSNWKEGWRVGESPDDLKNAPARIITLEKSELVAPGQVSASFKKLEATTLEVSVSPTFTIEGSTITVHGQIYPTLPNQNITLYLSADGSPWNVLSNSVTRSNGQFVYAWKSEAVGSVSVRAGWTGNDQYSGTTSEPKNTIILPFYLLALGALAIFAVTACAIVFLVTKSIRKPPAALPDANPETLETPQP